MPTNEQMVDVMIDLETAGLRSGAAVFSLGAVVMDLDGTDNWESLQTSPFGGLGTLTTNLRLVDQVKAGLHMDPNTLLWWLDQNDTARTELTSGQSKAANPGVVLSEFNEWLEFVTSSDLMDGNLPVRIWSNGANFDAPILRAVYDALGIECPWPYWLERCYRTYRKTVEPILEAQGKTVPDKNRSPEQNKHTALDDALHQAWMMTQYSRLLKVPDAKEPLYLFS